jgi:hypothetical protein
MTNQSSQLEEGVANVLAKLAFHLLPKNLITPQEYADTWHSGIVGELHKAGVTEKSHPDVHSVVNIGRNLIAQQKTTSEAHKLAKSKASNIHGALDYSLRGNQKYKKEDIQMDNWKIEIIKEGNTHKYLILDEDTIIAEGTNFTFDATVKSAYRKAIQLEQYVNAKVEQPSRVLGIVKSVTK